MGVVYGALVAGDGTKRESVADMRIHFLGAAGTLKLECDVPEMGAADQLDELPPEAA